MLCLVLRLYWLIVIGRILLEWIPVSYDHPLARLRSVLRGLTEPILAPLRRMLPPVRLGGMGLDLSPIILLFGIGILMGVVC